MKVYLNSQWASQLIKISKKLKDEKSLYTVYPVNRVQGPVDQVHWKVKMLTPRSTLSAVCPVDLLAWAVDHTHWEQWTVTWQATS